LREGYVLAFVRTAIIEALKSTAPVAQLPGVGRRDDADREASTRAPLPDARSLGSDRAINTAPRPAPAEPGTVEGSGFALSLPPDPAIGGRQESLDITFEREDPALNEPGGLYETFDPASSDQGSYSAPLSGAVAVEEVALPGLGHGIKPLGQIRDSYIVATDEEGLLLVDQHAAHERVLFEQIRDTKLARPANVQPLLIPETLDLTPAETAAFAEVQAELESVGIETMMLSGRTIAIKTAPAGLAAGDVVTLVRELLGVIERERRSFSIESIRDQIAASLACKAAIKVNMPLTSEKMQWLIDELMKTANPMTCPHGRPIIMRMDLREIERGFKRPV
jgi:DNA mismatch repair protein MutL